jgi:hypothetical protein
VESSTVLIKSLSLTFEAAVIGQMSQLHKQIRKRPTWSLGYRELDRECLYVYNVTMRLFRLCIVKVEKQQRVFLHCWPTRSCQQYKNIECFISILLWQIYLVGYSTTYIGLHVVLNNLSRFNRVWISPQISIQAPNTKFHGNPSSGSHAGICEQVDGHDRANWRLSRHCEFAWIWSTTVFIATLGFIMNNSFCSIIHF